MNLWAECGNGLCECCLLDRCKLQGEESRRVVVEWRGKVRAHFGEEPKGYLYDEENDSRRRLGVRCCHWMDDRGIQRGEMELTGGHSPVIEHESPFLGPTSRGVCRGQREPYS